jgi:hypothetical protein
MTSHRWTRHAMSAVAASAVAAGILSAGGGTALAATEAPSLAAAPQCDDGAWSGAGASVEGTPSQFAAGAAGATYVWHDGAGWHLRTTDATPGPHHYAGTIAASPGAALVGVTKVHLEPGDHIWVDPHQVLHYDFTTFQRVDGIDFHATACDTARTHESLTFALLRGTANESPADVVLGRDDHHPSSDPFNVTRTT